MCFIEYDGERIVYAENESLNINDSSPIITSITTHPVLSWSTYSCNSIAKPSIKPIPRQSTASHLGIFMNNRKLRLFHKLNNNRKRSLSLNDITKYSNGNKNNENDSGPKYNIIIADCRTNNCDCLNCISYIRDSIIMKSENLSNDSNIEMHQIDIRETLALIDFNMDAEKLTNLSISLMFAALLEALHCLALFLSEKVGYNDLWLHFFNYYVQLSEKIKLCLIIFIIFELEIKTKSLILQSLGSVFSCTNDKTVWSYGREKW